ncbi:adenosylcobalamin-dependent ribonucleoside-diphosphate reductase [Dehalogenimonas etheniformans]|uniref:Vitamin B12-dependent ribonucleotide reductase n=1 Tax=Dehalogenimonas etheniformans TaxID=1536648 RepID=A0A2P5PA15_9CHLR|nr:adenosylcobalamin-dependent ribonucleoside-diphosphate reductase [Dehalogenimonas etheniformans]PPD59149.1 adenosylcobalamin-dependent ribonucleoside-diphosphate reductase [Dehalogenimonas etheniformans]QNT75808.1 adenosylcobalamin-dependent ribonucleoside-diphosphate reductase [Dehalogenimonas etheniformans]
MLDLKTELSSLWRPDTDAFTELTPNARIVLEKRYLRRNERGELIETPREIFQRVAEAVAMAELNYDPEADTKAIADKFYRIMAGLLFLPNSPALLNAGTGSGQLAGSVVLSVEDSIASIFDTVKTAALVHQGGSGIGFNFSHVRPKGEQVGGRLDVALGPVALIDILSRATQPIRQGGIRRGCNSVALSVDHPDILEFIRAKSDQTSLANFYTCTLVTDDFMETVKTGRDYPLINPRTNEPVRWLNARNVFDQIVDQAWHSGDPGLIFIDRINEDNPTPHLGRIEHVSGCGEQPLLPNEFSHLGSINLSRMLKVDGDGLIIDFDKLQYVAATAVRFLDDALDVTRYPTPETMLATLRTRKIGLGVMGFADMLFQMRIPYDSEAAIGVAHQVIEFIEEEAHRASRELALERGSFPAFKGSIYDVHGASPIRNAACTTIAPTGTISLIAGCTCGIEPAFGTVFVRNAFKGEHQLLDINPHFEDAVRRSGVLSLDLLQRLVRHDYLGDQADVPEEIRRIFVTAHEVSPEWHVRMQAAFQEFTDAAVSKTVNLPASATREDLFGIFLQAYESRLKGITVYRDDSRASQPFCTGETGIKLVRAYHESRIVA